jgi:hypothetical protein
MRARGARDARGTRIKEAPPITTLESRNRQFLRDLFSGPFRGHAIVMDPEPIEPQLPGDIICPERPLRDWVDYQLRMCEARTERMEALDDDAVPYVTTHTGTQIFAQAFGCEVHFPEGSMPHAVPLVTTAEEADRLPQPSVYAPPLDRIWEFGEMVHARVGDDVAIRVPDIQSPFDIAALIWRKGDLYVAVYDRRDAVKRLVEKCLRLLTEFLLEWKRRFPNCNLCHCPSVWAPPELGMWLSEDEAGAMSAPMFEEFCLPSLVALSETFGGLFMHCCATADHQYPSFRKIPNLRGLQRLFQQPGARPAIETFSGHTVLVIAGYAEEAVHEMLDMALPDTRFLLNMPPQPLDDARRTYERLRERCPRSS